MRNDKLKIWLTFLYISLGLLGVALITVTVYSVTQYASTVYKIQSSTLISVKKDSGRELKNIDLTLDVSQYPTETSEFTDYMKKRYDIKNITYNFTDGTSYTKEIKNKTFNELKSENLFYPNGSIYHRWNDHEELEVTYDKYVFNSLDTTETKRFKVYQNDMMNIKKNTEVYIEPTDYTNSEFIITQDKDTQNITDNRNKPFWSNTNKKEYTINATITYSWMRRSGKVTNHETATIDYTNIK